MSGVTSDPSPLLDDPPVNASDQPGTVTSRALVQLIFVSGGRIVLLGAWFGATMLLARAIGPAAFGLYVLSQNAIKILTGCVGDPLDMAVMRECPLILKDNRARALHIVRAAFWMRVTIAASILLLAALIPHYTSKAIFNDWNLPLLGVLTMAGVLGDFLLRSVLGYFQIEEQFGRYMAVDVVWQAGRVIVIGVLLLLHKLSAPVAIELYVLAPYISASIGWLLLPRDIRRVQSPEKAQVVDILHYSKWIIAGMAMAAAYERLDVILLTRYRDGITVGLYAAAITWANAPEFLNGILQTVLAPKIAPAHAAGTFGQLQKWYLKFAIPFGIFGLIVALTVGGWIVQKFLGPAYHGVTPFFNILIFSTVFNLVFIPLPSALLNFVAPEKVTAFTTVGLVWVLVGGLLVIPHFGAIGAAWVMLSARVVVGIIILWQASHLGRRGRPPAAAIDTLPSQLPGHLEESL